MIQAPEAYLFTSVFSPHAFDAEIRIDQEEAFHAEILQLQIPDRMRRGDDAELSQIFAPGVFIGVVVVQVSDTISFFRPAAIFPDIVEDRSAAGKGRIHPDLRLQELFCDACGQIADAGDMPEGIKPGDHAVEAHEGVEVLFFQAAQEPQVGCAAFIPFGFIRIQKDQAACFASSKQPFFPVKERIQDIQIKEDGRFSFSAKRCCLLAVGIIIRQKPAADICIPCAVSRISCTGAQLLETL